MPDSVVLKLVRISCCECGLVFAFDENYVNRFKKSHKFFYCPNGHAQHFPQKTEEDKLRGQVKALRDMLDTTRKNRDRYKRSASAQKAAKTRLQNRVKHGVCPCCNRTFQNLQRHMASQHPEYAD